MKANIISFKNPGLIDPRAYRIFGVNAKTSTNAIGEFGTGLKYMIAVSLRLGAKISIWRGLEETILTTKQDSFRDKDFHFVVDQDEVELPFTTHLGHKWKAWMAFREAYCNVLDEGGTVGKLEDNFPEEDHTVIMIEDCEVLWQCYLERDTIVLPKQDPLFTSDDGGVIIYPGVSEFLYRRGVRADKCEPSTAFTYDFPNADLTEDRTFRYQWHAVHSLTHAIISEVPDHLLDRIFDSSRLGWEKVLSFNGVPSKAFLNKAQQRLNSNQYLPDKVLSLLVNNKSSQEMIDEMKTVQPTVFEEVEIERVLKLVSATGHAIARHDIKFKEKLPGYVLSLTSSGITYLDASLTTRPAEMALQIMKSLIQWRYECSSGSAEYANAATEEVIRTIRFFTETE